MTAHAKFLVLGAGMMGRATAYDLAKQDPGATVILADVDSRRASEAAKAIGPNVTPLRLDAQNADELSRAMDGCKAVVSAVSYSVNYDVSRAAIRCGVHMCDLGGNNDIVAKQLTLDADAKARGVAIVPNCGLAPGLINILAVGGAAECDEVESIALRVGGLPLHPLPPLNYQIVFSVEGLLNEYIEKAEILRDGRITSVDSLSELEEIRFPEPYGTLEAFTTSGGLSTLARHFEGKVKNLDYKTIRYPGHCEKFKTLLDLGFASGEPIMLGGGVRTAREMFTELLRKKLDTGGPDLILARATINGRRGSVRRTITYELIDRYDNRTGLSAMMRTTAFPTTIIAIALASGAIAQRGVLTPELCVPADTMINELDRRNVHITKRITETRS